MKIIRRKIVIQELLFDRYYIALWKYFTATVCNKFKSCYNGRIKTFLVFKDVTVCLKL